MTVALDATPLTVATGGTRRYTLELARALARRFPEDQYWLLSDQPFSGPKSASNLHPPSRTEPSSRKNLPHHRLYSHGNSSRPQIKVIKLNPCKFNVPLRCMTSL